MPIYAYRCDECGFAKDVLQKMSDPVLTVCPSCAKSSFKKQVTAAGFQLKGTGWYVTDFRGGSAPATGTAPATDSGSTSTTSTSSSPSSDSSAAPAAATTTTTTPSGDA
jgi:putative FmdB family regulatory protein